MVSLKALSNIVLLLIIITSQMACGLAGNDAGTEELLAVTSVKPINAKTDVPLDAAISVIFNKKVHSSTITGNAFTVTSTSAVSGKVNYKASTQTLTFTPDSDLPPKATITVAISTDVRDLDGNRLAAEYTWAFITAAKVDKTPPTTAISTITDGVDDRPSVVLKCVDDDSGCANTHYTLDKSKPTTESPAYTDPILLQAGNTTVSFFSIDTAGNSETVRAKSYVIAPLDVTAPTTSASVADGMYDSVTFVSLACTDNDSGCRTTYFTLDGSTPTNLSRTYSDVLKLDTDTTLRFFSVDMEGNREVVKTHTYVINLAAKKIAAGVSHSMTLKDDGTVWAWGDNQYGQLGDGTQIQSSRPVQVCVDDICSQFLADVSAVATGGDYSLVLKSSGIWSWGLNISGQLGNSTTDNSSVPVQVCANAACSTYLSSVTALAAGRGYALALKEDGTVWAWGLNTSGQLGNSTTDNSSVPVQVCAVVDCSSYLSQVVRIVAGEKHAVAIKEDGTVWAWGLNTSRQLGNSSADIRSIPVQVCAVADCSSYLTKVIAVAAGDAHTLALKENGTVWAWGGNWSGQLGINSRDLSSIPVQVCAVVDVATKDCTAYLDQVFTLTAAYDQNMALKEDGTAWVWGENDYGQLGDGTREDRLIPVKVCADVACKSYLNKLAALAVGHSHSLAMNKDGVILTWGRHHKGQLGESKLQRLIPGQVAGPSDMIALAAGGSHSVGLKEDGAGSGAGTVWAWGDNRSGQLGNGTTRLSSRPVQVCADEDCDNYLNNIVALAAGDGHTLALQGDSVWAWGLNTSGQLGNSSADDQSIPVQVCSVVDCSEFLDGATMLSAGDYHSVVLHEDGSVWAWGQNTEGQLGDGTTINRLLPQQVCLEEACSSKFIAVVAVGLHTMALKNDGTVWAWGTNSQGQLGNGSTVQSLIPVQVCAVADCSSYLDAVAALGDGNGSHSIVRKEDGTVWAWGANQQGQLGDNSTEQSLIPLPVCVDEECSNLSGIDLLLAIGGAYSLALAEDKTILGWGSNVRGQLGSGTTDQSLIPMPVCEDADCATSLSGIGSLATGREHSIALSEDATIWSWGLNDRGQLGNSVNPLLIRTTPDIVLGL